jgi:hypothetical protein
MYSDTEEGSCDLSSEGSNCVTHHQLLAAVAAKIIYTPCHCVWHHVKYWLFFDEACCNLHGHKSSQKPSVMQPQLM